MLIFYLSFALDLCLQLFVNFNVLSNESEANYYEAKISSELESLNIDIFVPNSIIMEVINLSMQIFFLLLSHWSKFIGQMS